MKRERSLIVFLLFIILVNLVIFNIRETDLILDLSNIKLFTEQLNYKFIDLTFKYTILTLLLTIFITVSVSYQYVSLKIISCIYMITFIIDFIEISLEKLSIHTNPLLIACINVSLISVSSLYFVYKNIFYSYKRLYNDYRNNNSRVFYLLVKEPTSFVTWINSLFGVDSGAISLVYEDYCYKFSKKNNSLVKIKTEDLEEQKGKYIRFTVRSRKQLLLDIDNIVGSKYSLKNNCFYILRDLLINQKIYSANSMFLSLFIKRELSYRNKLKTKDIV